MAPLVAYILSLRAPSNPTPPDPSLVSTGASLYVSKGCATCHDGPRGSGKRAYAISEVGTDPAMAEWADPDGGPVACCGVPTAPGGLTHGLKSPRLVGMWTMGRFLHNGALSSLQQLFCMDADAGAGDAGRPPAGTVPMETTGHDFTCTGLADSEKQALVAYLLSH
jgi:cytochrome c peroxidase